MIFKPTALAVLFALSAGPLPAQPAPSAQTPLSPAMKEKLVICMNADIEEWERAHPQAKDAALADALGNAFRALEHGWRVCAQKYNLDPVIPQKSGAVVPWPSLKG